MKSLIRNCTHSEVYLLEETDQAGSLQAIWKSSSSPEGVKHLRHELVGIGWYNGMSKKQIKVTVDHETRHYLSLKFDYIKGRQFSYKGGVIENKQRIIEALEHYCEIWGALPKNESGLYPFHGDLSLDNFIFMDEGVVMLDWEHFSESAVPLGFDGLYLIFESLWFELKKNKLNENILNCTADMISFMRKKNCLDDRYLRRPLHQVVSFIKDNSTLWGRQLVEYKVKLPVVLFDDNVAIEIDLKIERLIKPDD